MVKVMAVGAGGVACAAADTRSVPASAVTIPRPRRGPRRACMSSPCSAGAQMRGRAAVKWRAGECHQEPRHRAGRTNACVERAAPAVFRLRRPRGDAGAESALPARAVGQWTPFQDEIRCGPDRIANTAAAGDDLQLIPVGYACQGTGAIVVDTGPDGIANSTAAGDDVQIIPLGNAAPNTPCVLTGANGLADTPDPAGGDDVRILLVGHAEPNTPVIPCGPNHVRETTATNVHARRDD